MSRTPPENCHHVQLADSHIGHVSICPDCGVVHLSLNHVTVRLSPEAFCALATMTGEAQLRLEYVSRAGVAAAAVIDEARHGPKLH